MRTHKDEAVGSGVPTGALGFASIVCKHRLRATFASTSCKAPFKHLAASSVFVQQQQSSANPAREHLPRNASRSCVLCFSPYVSTGMPPGRRKTRTWAISPCTSNRLDVICGASDRQPWRCVQPCSSVGNPSASETRLVHVQQARGPHDRVNTRAAPRRTHETDTTVRGTTLKRLRHHCEGCYCAKKCLFADPKCRCALHGVLRAGCSPLTWGLFVAQFHGNGQKVMISGPHGSHDAQTW